MKSKSIVAIGILALTSGNMFAATRTFNMTGATAFRSAAHNSIINLLGGTGVTKYAFTGTSGVTGANLAIFEGTMSAFPGDVIIVRTSFSGSTQGILDLADANTISFLDSSNNRTTTGINLGQGSSPAAALTTAVPRWSFSDVDKLLSTRPNATLAGGPVGVVPFMFLAGEGSPSTITNITDQIHETLWSTGSLSASFFTGNPADAGKVALATGRNNGSGTRASILSETQYGSATNVVQYNATFQGTRTEAYPTAKLNAITEFAGGSNDGHTSNSFVRDLLTRSSIGMTFGGNPVDGFFVSYLTISDALLAVSEGARELTYNGVPYSENNVKNGKYTLWGYQQLYLGRSATTAEITFDTQLRATIPTHMGTAGIPVTSMNVTRTGGDGGPVFPNN